ncbi:hypothetical protein EDB92DRAFT_2103236 [Lactarius akahatsu]|uniref:Secreted protein n=1 Tax=Lactarius akahatsu TaxID=416441 RepID=A0AAD4LI91_9AGAM|nr:hypothetical protein EDB92DRAFT_2103236 [Lactarius akahatsu]
MYFARLFLCRLATLLRAARSETAVGAWLGRLGHDVNDPGSLRYYKPRDETPPGRVVCSGHLQDDFGSPASPSKTPDAFGQSASFARDACVFPRPLMIVRGCGNSWACSLRFARATPWGPPAWETMKIEAIACIGDLITAKTHDESHQSQAITMGSVDNPTIITVLSRSSLSMLICQAIISPRECVMRDPYLAVGPRVAQDKSSSELVGLSNAPVIGNARGRPHLRTRKNLADF